jgi:hypothetical protein
MPRFFFNYRERNEYTVDDAGVEFDTFELAYLDAFNAAREMWPEAMSQRLDPRACAFEICDEQGRLLAILNFNEVLERCHGFERTKSRDIQRTIAEAVDTAQRASRNLAEFHHELARTRGRLQAVKRLISLIEVGTDRTHWPQKETG